MKLLRFNLHKRLINLRTTPPDPSPALRNREADERRLQMYVTVEAPDRAIKIFEMTDP